MKNKILSAMLMIFVSIKGEARVKNESHDFKNEKVPVAFVAALSGSDPHTAQELVRGLRVFEATQKSPFEIKVFDNKGDPEKTYSLFKELKEQKYKLIVGLARSDEALVAARAAEENKQIFLTPFATNPSISKKFSSAFQVCFNDDEQGEVLALFANSQLKAKKILVLKNSQSNYSIGLTESFVKNIQVGGYREEGGAAKSFVQMVYENSLESLKDIAAAVEFKKIDLVFVPDHIQRASLIAKELVKINPHLIFLGGDGFGGAKMMAAIFGKTPEIDLYYSTHWYEEILFKKNRQFVKKYMELFPESRATSGAARSFDALNVLNQIFQNGRLQRSGVKVSDLETPKLIDILRHTKFETTVGDLKFSERKPIVMIHTHRGVMKPVRLAKEIYGSPN